MARRTRPGLPAGAGKGLNPEGPRIGLRTAADAADDAQPKPEENKLMAVQNKSRVARDMRLQKLAGELIGSGKATPATLVRLVNEGATVEKIAETYGIPGYESNESSEETDA